MTVEIISWSISTKDGTGPGSNSRPLDLQLDSHLLPDTLPTALRGPVYSISKQGTKVVFFSFREQKFVCLFFVFCFWGGGGVGEGTKTEF